MSERATTAALVGIGFGYLVLLGWSIVRFDYDTWGAIVNVPVLFLLGVLGLRVMFRGALAPLLPIMVIGLGIKFFGAWARYFVAFEAYDGVTDANRYHRTGTGAATAVWNGEASVLSLIPEGTGTPFMEDLAGVIYFFSGTSLIGAYMVFAWIAYWGTAWFVKAAAIAVPGLAQHRYALLCVLAPSMMYWPSSIGKEAWMMFTLGLATYGIAMILARQGLIIPVAMAGFGLLGGGLVRPHMAGLLIAALVPALALGLLVTKAPSSVIDGDQVRSVSRGRDRLALLGVVMIALVGLSLAAGTTVRYLNPNEEEVSADAITGIFDETSRRTTKGGGSTFQPISIDNPANWPYAVVRTLTRPLPHEARGLAQLIAAAEMAAFIGIAAMSWRRIANIPKMILTNRYVAFSVAALILGGLAFSSFGNLGVLTRQKSLLFPFLLLLVCLPPLVSKARRQLSDDERPADTPIGRDVPAGWRGGDLVAVAASSPVQEWQPSRPKVLEIADPPAWEPTVRANSDVAGSVRADWGHPGVSNPQRSPSVWEPTRLRERGSSRRDDHAASLDDIWK